MKKMLAIALILLATAITSTSPAQSAQSAASPQVIPAYDKSRGLILPADYRHWILAGASLGLSYTESAAPHPMFHETLIEPTAYNTSSRPASSTKGRCLC